MNTKILFVEDDRSILELQMTVAKRMGCDVRGATDGEEGWQIARREYPDAVILDVMLPGCDGFTLASRLREDSQTRHIPIAFVTARRETADFLRGFDSGGMLYLAKPFSARALQTVLRTLTGPGAKTASKEP